MTFLITGAAGFIGSKLSYALLYKYDSFENKFIFLINKNKLDFLEENKFKSEILVIKKNIKEISKRDKIFEGVDYVFHLAAFLKYGHRDKKEYFKINVDATKNILSSCSFYNIKKVIYLSTAGIFHPTHSNIINEASNLVEKHITNYTYTKYLAHLEVEKFKNEGLNVISILPVSVFGEGSPLFSGIIKDVIRNKFIFLPKIDSRLSLIYVDDLVEGILKAFEKGELGQDYIFSGKDLSLDEIVIKTEKIIGKRVRVIHFSVPLCFLFFYIIDIMSKIFHHDFFYNKDFFNFVRGGLLANDDKSRRHLDFKDTRFDNNFKKMVDSFHI